ncbi:MAG: branched-chain amino acid aminotransferase [Bacteroidales bacterium]|nr:branched-chain amino acid aminotransferase [Bacteroidales bacterium]
MQNTDWKNLPFAYRKTNCNVRYYFKNGEWSSIEITDSEYINLHMASTCLHYGQEIFEGLKAYRGKDNRIRLFRWEENSQRLINSAEGVEMQPVPKEMFCEAILTVVKENEKYVPPYGYGATLYIRPLLLGISAEVGVKPSKEYLFMVFVTPVGPYFREGFAPVDIMICRKFDRAAPLGTGAYKVGGNYAASLISLKEAHEAGFGTTLFLDAKEKKYIDEAGPANFFAIKGNTYITPDSKSILPSITNMSLMELAKDMGMKVERRPVSVEELKDFDEVGACGTAAVITPVRKIIDPDANKIYQFGEGNQAGPVSSRLYRKLTAIQTGDEKDKFGWITYVD